MWAEFYRMRRSSSGRKLKEDKLTDKRWIRQSHRWLSIAFTLCVVANFVAMAWGPPPAWITYSPLLPLLLMMLTGLTMFVQPYSAAWAANHRQG
jgi:intracellular septation protein A